MSTAETGRDTEKISPQERFLMEIVNMPKSQLQTELVRHLPDLADKAEVIFQDIEMPDHYIIKPHDVEAIKKRLAELRQAEQELN
ncbi:MAG: hypothetical protein WC480_00250 [Patescibacteria group bacterium]